MQKNKNIGYLIKEGFRGIFLHGFMSFAAVCVTVACLILIGSFYLIMLNVNKIVETLDRENQVVAFIDETFGEAEAKSVGSRINMISVVSKAEFVSKEAAFAEFIAGYDNPEAFSGLPTDTFRHRFVITLKSSADMAEAKEKLETIPGIAEVSASFKIAEGFATVRGVLQIVSSTLIIILTVVSLFIISNTVKLAMYDRKDEIAIMKMVGATNSFIRIPFVIEGFVIGTFSAAIAFFGEWGIYDFLGMKIAEIQTSFAMLSMISFENVLPLMVAVYVLAGLFVGVFGSLMSIRRFLEV